MMDYPVARTPAAQTHVRSTKMAVPMQSLSLSDDRLATRLMSESLLSWDTKQIGRPAGIETLQRSETIDGCGSMLFKSAIDAKV